MNSIKNIVIAGGGTAGWMTAASLAKHFPHLSICLVESSEIGTIGVGEATIPTIRHFNRALGLSDQQVMKRTGATCKLGIQFNGWHTESSSFIHPFGVYGESLNGVGFHHYWLKNKKLGDPHPLESYSVGAQLAKHGKFALPPSNPASSLAVFDWALHLDASKYAQLLKEVATDAGVKRVDAKIIDVILHPESGHIDSLNLSNGQQVHGDFFIDCTGFSSLLLGQALKVDYKDWNNWLLCDRAIAVQSETDVIPNPYTEANAKTAGWQWRIPLQHRQGNGHVYSSQHTSDEAALDSLLADINGEPISEPKCIRFRPGCRERFWVKNCVALGLAAGFFEPIESTNIALIETAIERLKLFFPYNGIHSSAVEEFNVRTTKEYESVRDFVLLHYLLNARKEPFWQDYRNISLPDTLLHRMSLYQTNGILIRQRHEIFQPNSWLAIYDGFHYLPTRHDPCIDKVEDNYIRQGLAQMREGIAKAVSATPAHQNFLNQL
ncbi:tryptophan halogenase family protein [Bowmanella yangjiangensis]|uniref:Tryptophan 7-halogenase n=1 Tax=Bowmanella yangjiangensis TaxID=2811230 RepID=A0ABS3CU69_9ALTE|nr:tryptophan halogenase family protein [Bowmanella yangjiangensis]MBN7820654.1 tryptophan 7-halogenase [Bowmanella yangjiangensis]